ncbi:amino acid transporter [Mycobacterium frederiksbergense]|uniref:Amino acid transporter n=1 Tax=Mycolicibacterium frederiksbergense TaxID=117567 RepID=A0ABT6KYR7_9MYCO|nr:APC family permease [Mycolicibacterium frederiksbergense]MDH6195838.1 amino acid transporter [Mycolicibacterium frederiksbergense]
MTANEGAALHSVEEVLPRKMRWFDGFAMAMTMPAALVATLGATITGLGGWGAAVLWAISMVISLAVNWIYTELAAMFPNASGGISGYVAEAWKKRAPWLAPLAGVGYWLPWGSNLATYGSLTGLLVQSQWFPDEQWTFDAGPLHFSFPILIGLGVIFLLYGINVIGVRVTMVFVYVTAGILMIPLSVFIIFPMFNSGWAPMDLTWKLHGLEGLHTAIVWLYVMAWTTLGIEVCATFASEYRDPVKDTSRAIRASALFCLGVFFLVPLTLGGFAGEQAIGEDPSTFFVASFSKLTGAGADIMVLCLIASLLLVMLTSVADASRVLFNMGKEGITVRAMGKLNSRGVPVRALNVMLVLNIVLLVVLQQPLAIIVTGNLGYILVHVLAVAGFALLRKDQPDALRPIRLPQAFVPLSIGLVVVLTIMLVVGATGFSITGYGGILELCIALSILSAGVLLWWFVQRHDRSVRARADVSD